MSRRSLPLDHPLAQVFFAAIESVTTSMSDSSKRPPSNHDGILSPLSERASPSCSNPRTTAARPAHPGLVEMALRAETATQADACFPRPLTPEQDRLIRQELLRRNDVASNALLLIRHTGIRIGECADLSLDCLRPIAPGQWALHVPLGKLHTERLVPVVDFVCELVHRLRFFRFLSTTPPDGLLLARRHNRAALLCYLRTELTKVRTAVGITRRIVPHMFRHTFAYRDASERYRLSSTHEAAWTHLTGNDNTLR